MKVRRLAARSAVLVAVLAALLGASGPAHAETVLDTVSGITGVPMCC